MNVAASTNSASRWSTCASRRFPGKRSISTSRPPGTISKDKRPSNARITVRHNGVVIHENLELKDATPGRMAEGPEKAGVFLQDHGNPVVFRNIWVVPK